MGWGRYARGESAKRLRFSDGAPCPRLCVGMWTNCRDGGGNYETDSMRRDVPNGRFDRDDVCRGGR